MILEDQKCDSVDENGARNEFPVGMSVLAVDDDPICLKMLETLLRKCQYQVTATNQAIKALTMLRENRNKFDLVISDVNMPDMDGFKLLELVGLEMDLPVIMLSAHSDTRLVMKGVTHGACDYLLKPVRMEQLKNIWQHVVRRRRFDGKDQNKAPNEEKANTLSGEGNLGIVSDDNSDQSLKLGKRRKDQGEDEEDGEDNGLENEEEEDPSTQKKPRVVWSAELHKKFVGAVYQLGPEKAVPKKILDLMNVDGLTRENVASHLQKFRLYLKKTQQVNIVAAMGVSDTSYLRMSSLDGFGDFRSLSGSGRLSPTFTSSGIFSRLNSPAGLNLRGIGSSGLIRPGHSQNTSTSINTLGNLHPSSMSPANQSSSLFQSMHSPMMDLSQSQPSSCITGIRQLSSIEDSGGFSVASAFQDNTATVGSANNSVPCVSSNELMLQGISQQPQNMGTFRNQSSLGTASTSLNSESFNFGIFGSNFLDYTRCNESWEGAVQLSKFPSNSVPLNDTFNNDNLSPCSINVSSSDNNPVEFSSVGAIPVPLEYPRSELQCQEGLIGNVVQSSFAPRQNWELHKQDYNQNLNCAFNSVNSLVSSNEVRSTFGQSLNQNNALCSSRRLNASSFVDSINGATTSITRSNDAYILDQTKQPQDGFIHSIGSLDDIVTAMVKREQNEMLMMDGEMGFDAYPIGSCI